MNENFRISSNLIIHWLNGRKEIKVSKNKRKVFENDTIYWIPFLASISANEGKNCNACSLSTFSPSSFFVLLNNSNCNENWHRHLFIWNFGMLCVQRNKKEMAFSPLDSLSLTFNDINNQFLSRNFEKKIEWKCLLNENKTET